jgi:hypothetical protein
MLLSLVRLDETLGRMEFIQVDSKSLRNHLIPITVRTLDTIIALLIKNARDETLSVLNTFQDRIRQLEIRPLQLDAFVNFVTVRKQFFFVFFPLV